MLCHMMKLFDPIPMVQGHTLVGQQQLLPPLDQSQSRDMSHVNVILFYSILTWSV